MFQGFLQAINKKETQFGAMYDLVVDGTSYGVGKFAPKQVAVGDYIQFNATQKPGSRFWNVQAGTLSKLDKPAGVSPPPAPSAPSSGGYSGGSDKRQEVISKQAALNTALTFVKLLSDNGALPVPAKATKDKLADIIEGVVFHYTAKYYKLATGDTYAMPEAEDSGDTDLLQAEEPGSWNE